MEDKPKYTGRGGWHGGGRPANDRTVIYSTRLTPENKAYLDQFPNKTQRINELLDAALLASAQ